MHFIILSVICSVTVSIILKLAPRLHLDVKQVIGGGYLVAATLCYVLLKPAPRSSLQEFNQLAWGILIVLGVLLPSLFLVLSNSIDHVGIVLTDAAQRLSLLLPLIAAFAFFGEKLTVLKGYGISLGLVAMICIVARPGAASEHETKAGGWYWPLIVFLGAGLVDILFKQMAQLKFADVLFATFVLAFVLSMLYLGYLYLRRQAQWGWQNVWGALGLGVFNFGNILFYIQAHRHLKNDPALVFSAMNIGVIVVGALVGMWLFQERLGKFNKIGLALAILAVIILARAS